MFSHLARAPGIVTLREESEDRALLLQAGALDARVTVAEPEGFAVALVEATGSISHVGKLAHRAEQIGLGIDGHALRRGRGRVSVASEEEFYSLLELQFVPPEMREDAGEIEAAVSEDFRAISCVSRI